MPLAGRLIAGAVLVGLAGCAGQPGLDRWTHADGLPDYAAPQLYLSSAPSAPSDPLSVRNMPERAAAAYITALAAKETASKDLRAALAAKIAASAGVRDTTQVGRVMIVGVERPQYRPGDRLLSTIVTIAPPPSDTARSGRDFDFTDYQLAATDRAAVDIGQVSVTDERSANVGVSPAGTPTLEGVSAGVSATRTRSASRSIHGESELSVHVEPGLIQIFRTGAEGHDLTGSTLIKLSVRLPPEMTIERTIADPQIRGDKGEWLSPDKARIGLSFIALQPARDLWVCARMTYQDRRVLTGQAAYDEGRQSVSLQPGDTGWRPYLIVPADDMATPLWVIWEPRRGPIEFDDGVEKRMLTFSDYDGAQTFAAWLRTKQPGKLANGQLLGATQSPIADFAHLRVQPLDQDRAPKPAPSCAKA